MLPGTFELYSCWIVTVSALLISRSSCGTIQDSDDGGWSYRWRDKVVTLPPWDEVTRYPWYKESVPPWDRYIYSQLDDDVDDGYTFDLKSTLDTPMTVTIVLIFFALIFVLLFKYHFKKKGCDCCNGDSTISRRNPPATRPPRTANPPRIPVTTAPSPVLASPAMQPSTPLLSSPLSVANYTNNNSMADGDSLPTFDKPPDYFAVVLDDLTQQAKFPEVKPVTTLDTPPPKYDEKFFLPH